METPTPSENTPAGSVPAAIEPDGQATDARAAEGQRAFKLSLPIVAAGLILIALLAGAAFVGARFLSAQSQPPDPQGDFFVKGSGAGVAVLGGSGPGATSFRLEIEHAKELPNTPSDVSGVLTRREDNSLFLGTGKIMMAFSKGNDGNAQPMKPSFDGPVVEVVLTRDTQIYRDVTGIPAPGSAASGKVQQVVEPGSKEDIGENTVVHVWGEKRGDRTVAQILVYTR
ncbi:MAG: hypothetical protein HY326_07505 [Chloroflexi bacterium]|nr:hypothetical protein [Chloroflexota bacterium]